MLLNVAAHNVETEKCQNVNRHKTYSVTKRTVSQNVLCHLRNVHFAFCNSICYVTLYVMCRLRFENFTFWNSYVVCMQLRCVTLRHGTFTLCALRYVATS
jgi:hypothetical protein